MKRPLTNRERAEWLQLARTPNVGPVTFHRLMGRFGSAAAALEALPRLSRGALTPPSRDSAEDEIAAVEAMGGRILAACEPNFPSLLAELTPPPPVLSARGRLNLFERPAIALVGAREASAAGLRLAEDFARGLGEAGVVVVSGLARGIDAAAHAASLRTGTIGVLAGGLDRPYPPQNQCLHDRIAVEGVVASEAPLGCVARARDFPRRNHIISGLARAVVVVEAALRSGSLITARAAADQGRDVMAAPASPLDPRGRGGNALLKDGAILVETADDVLAMLRGLAPSPAPSLFEPLGEASPPAEDLLGRLACALSPTPVHVNDLSRLLAAPANEVAAALTELELEGRAATLPGGYGASSAAAFRTPA